MAKADQDAKKNKISWIVALAQSIKRPLAFFVSMGFLLVIFLIPLLWFNTPNDLTWELAVPLSVVFAALPVTIVCALLWAKARIAKDPTAFQNES